MKTFEEPVIEIKALILIISQFVKVNELRYKQCWVIPHFSIYWKSLWETYGYLTLPPHIKNKPPITRKNDKLVKISQK